MKLEIVQSLQQQQILAPQMILSMDILLLTSQELETRIEKEFMENPALEIKEPSNQDAPDHPSVDEKTPEFERAVDQKDGLFDHLESFQNLPSFKFFEDGPRRRTAPREGEYDKHEALQNAEGDPPCLRDHLVQQIHLLDLPVNLVEIAEFIVNNVDERGYLLHPAKTLRYSLGRDISDEDFDQALRAVRSLDPSGVGAENLVECLLLQLDRDLQSYPLETEILTKHITDLQKNKIPKIARDLGKTVEDIKDAIDIIRMLQPCPGRQYSPEKPRYVRPDVVIDSKDGKFSVRIQDNNLPPLQVSETCRNLLTEARGNKEITGFLRKKIDSAQWLMLAVEQRRRTLHEITKAMTEYQTEFMDKGPEKLRSMKMQTIADIVGVHISTISRAIKGKYVDTPHGLFELRYFFTGGVEREDGNVESRRNVYRRISELIDGEDKSRPLSDTDIANVLRKEGLEIARRTVTKYRDQRDIPASRLRKTY
jgi:RNA polymerase sigma-54 factor